MKKVIVIFAFLLILVVPALALSNETLMCGDEIQLNQNCTMLTPTLNCGSYDYKIFNLTGGLAESGTLTQLNETIYYFNWTRTNETGKYIVELCDGTTREVIVSEGGEGMIPGILIISPLIIGILMILGAMALPKDNPKMEIFKITLFLVSFAPIFMSLRLGLMFLVKYYDFPELASALSDDMWSMTWIMIIIFIGFMIYACYLVYGNIKKDKEDKLQY